MQALPYEVNAFQYYELARIPRQYRRIPIPSARSPVRGAQHHQGFNSISNGNRPEAAEAAEEFKIMRILFQILKDMEKSHGMQRLLE